MACTGACAICVGACVGCAGACAICVGCAGTDDSVGFGGTVGGSGVCVAVPATSTKLVSISNVGRGVKVGGGVLVGLPGRVV